MFGNNGNGVSPDVRQAISAGLSGQLSVDQASLHRQASVIATDALRALDTIQSFSNLAESERVEALRALVRAEIKSIVDEMGRVDGPRPERIDTFFKALLGTTNSGGNLNLFGQRAFVNASVVGTTVPNETEVARFKLLKDYAVTLRGVWKSYKSGSGPNFCLQLTARACQRHAAGDCRGQS